MKKSAQDYEVDNCNKNILREEEIFFRFTLFLLTFILTIEPLLSLSLFFSENKCIQIFLYITFQVLTIIFFIYLYLNYSKKIKEHKKKRDDSINRMEDTKKMFPNATKTHNSKKIK